MNKIHFIFKIFILIALILNIQISEANALEFTNSIDGSTVSCDSNADETIAVKVVSCIKNVINNYSTALLAFMTTLMEPIIWALILLCIILTAMRVMLGERNPVKIMLASFFKILVVIMLANNFGADSGMFDAGGLKDVTFLLMEGMQTVIVDNMYEDTATCQLSNHSGQTSALISESAYRPFAYMDCILEYIMGFNIAAGIGASLLGFISSALFSGTMGASVFFFGIATLLAVTFFVLRVIFTVIVCYIYAGLLIGLAPMIVWTLMFKYSEQAFFKYLYNILAAVFMPFLMVAFMAFAIPLLDRYVLDPNEPQSLVNVLGTQQSGGGVGTGDRIVDHYRPESPLCNMQTPTDPLYAQGLDQTQIRENSLNPLQTGSFDWCSTFRVHSVDLGDQHNEKLWDIAQSLLQILFIVWIITSVGNWIPQLASGLLQSQGAGALAHLISSEMPMEGLLQGGFRSQVTAATATNGQPLGGFNGMGSLFGKFR